MASLTCAESARFEVAAGFQIAYGTSHVALAWLVGILVKEAAKGQPFCFVTVLERREMTS